MKKKKFATKKEIARMIKKSEQKDKKLDDKTYAKKKGKKS